MPVDNSNYIYRMGTAPNTRTVISQKNKIYGYSVGANGFLQIGAVSEFSHEESRTIDPVRGVGFGDQIAELVPGVTEPMTLTLNKSMLYTSNLFQDVGYLGGIDGLVRSLRHHRWPFDIRQELVMSELIGTQGATSSSVGGTENQPAIVQPGSGLAGPGDGISNIQALYTYFEGCWFNSYSASYTSDAAIVAETSSVTVTDIIDGLSSYGEFINSGLAPTSTNGAPGAGFSIRFAGGSNAPAGATIAGL
jgi:hypothetical protein